MARGIMKLILKDGYQNLWKSKLKKKIIIIAKQEII